MSRTPDGPGSGNRRGFLRWLALGGLLVWTGVMTTRRGSSSADVPGGICDRTGLCRGCPKYRGCVQPQALSMQQAEGDSHG